MHLDLGDWHGEVVKPAVEILVCVADKCYDTSPSGPAFAAAGSDDHADNDDAG